MSQLDRVAIVGLGLMGGSLAHDLAARGVQVSAFDHDAEHLAAALRAGAVHRALDSTLAGVADAQIVVIAVPVDEAVTVLERIAPFSAGVTLITDVGSTKERIVAAAASLGLADRFVGSHPMAGDHRSGWPAARAELFQGADVYLCAGAGVAKGAEELATALWAGLGARPVVLPADEHDRRLAWTSHLPHMVSVTLALALARTGIRRNDLGPGGRDVTRLAGSSPAMWSAIALDNAAELDAALGAAEREIADLRLTLRRRDSGALRQRFATARTWFDPSSGQ